MKIGTLITLHNKAIAIIACIDMASGRASDNASQRMFYKAVYNYDVADHYTERIEINNAIIARLTAYYLRIMNRIAALQPLPSLSDATTNKNIPTEFSSNIL